MEYIISKNKKAIYDYELKEFFLAGISLLGAEVKGIKDIGISIKESYIRISKCGKKLLLTGATIPIPEYACQENINPTRDRVLLVSKREREKIKKEISKNGLTIIPISVILNKNGLIKLSIAIGRGKKTYDKREAIKKRDIERSL